MLFEENKVHETSNALIQSMMNNSLYSMEAIKKSLNPASEKQAILTEEEIASKNEEFGFTRADTLTTIFSSPKAPMNRTRPASALRTKRSNLLPPDDLIRSGICEALQIDESKLTTQGGKLSLESKEATK